MAFVPTSALREPVENGKTFVQAIVVEIAPAHFMARLAGHPMDSRPFEGEPSNIEKVGAL